MAGLSAVLLDFSAKLRARAIGGVLEGSASELAGAIPLRTFRYRVASLVEAKVIERENVQGSRVRLVFKSTATENGNSATRTATSTATAATGGVRGGPDVSPQPKESTKERQPQQHFAVPQERQERTATLAEGWVRVIVEGPPHLVKPLLAEIHDRDRAAGRVSREKAPDFSARDASVDEEELVLERFEQLKDDGTPVKKPQVMRALVLNDIRKDSGLRAALERSMHERRSAAEHAKGASARALEGRRVAAVMKREQGLPLTDEERALVEAIR